MPLRMRYFVFFLLVLVAAGMCALIVVGGYEVVATERTSEATTPQESSRVQEIVELRDATSKTYELEDGKREWVTNGDVIHYQDEASS